MNAKIDAMQPGQSLEISSFNGVTVKAERSGCGKWISFVRFFANGSFETFKTGPF